MKKILVFIFIVLILAFAAALPLTIKVNVDCKSQYGTCPQQTLDKINQYNGKSISAAKAGIRKVLKADFLVSDFSIQFKLPNTLHAELLVKKAVAAIGTSATGPFVLVDRNGEAIAVSGESALPLVIIAGDLPKVGENIGTVNLFATRLARGIYQMYQVNQSMVADGSLLVELPGQIRVIFPLDGDSDILLGSLRLIYSKIEGEGNPNGYSQIDLRFASPVLR